MDFKKAIKEIKVLLGMETETEVKLETAKLKDGTTVEFENLEVGTIVYVVTPATEETEETKAPAPEGTHELEDGTKITVDAEGKITEVVKVEETETETEETEKVENAEQFRQKFYEATNEEITNTMNWMLDYIFGLESKIWTLQDQVAQYETAKEEMQIKMAKIEGAVAAMFGQFEKMEPLVSEFNSVKEKVETIESTPAGKSIFHKEEKKERELTLAEQRIEAIKQIKNLKK